MMMGKCGKSTSLCPFSLGLAVGITCALSVLFWFVWASYMGSMPAGYYMDAPANFTEAGIRALLALARGFVAGFVVAFIYDVVMCMCKARCCKSSECEKSCECSCNKSDAQK